MSLMSKHISEVPEFSRPAPAELVAWAVELVRTYPECFWFWNPAAQVRHLEAVRLVVDHLRKYGDRRAWSDAQELYRCLLPIFKKKSQQSSLRTAPKKVTLRAACCSTLRTIPRGSLATLIFSMNWRRKSSVPATRMCAARSEER